MIDNNPLDTLRRLFTVEDTKRTDDTDLPYECRKCGSQFDKQHPVCPDCGGRSIEQANWDIP